MQIKIASALGGAALLGLVILVGCAGGQAGSQAPPPPPPVIHSFAAGATSVTAGEPASLTATFSNGRGVIDGGVGQVESGVPVVVMPNADTVYTLSVANGAGTTASSSVLVKVDPPLAVPGIFLPPTVIGGQTYSASVVPQPRCTYRWTIVNGVIVGPADGFSVMFTAGPSGVLQLVCTVTRDQKSVTAVANCIIQ